jgi:predicted nicotinamide N-methyase
VWSGALLLADYILSNQEAFLECTALEVGAGTGLAGIVLSRLARRVFLTDCTAHVLQNCQACMHACPLQCFLVHRLHVMLCAITLAMCMCACSGM